jgi:hypothetical protein
MKAGNATEIGTGHLPTIYSAWFFFLVVKGPARYGRTAAMRLIVQPYDEDDHYFLSFS